MKISRLMKVTKQQMTTTLPKKRMDPMATRQPPNGKVQEKMPSHRRPYWDGMSNSVGLEPTKKPGEPSDPLWRGETAVRHCLLPLQEVIVAEATQRDRGTLVDSGAHPHLDGMAIPPFSSKENPRVRTATDLWLLHP
ncbi:hypothetical protein RUM44_005455 [Polyplax serrata]|uniref:Uncharacterized protein n=1 Tax=Polyplax serrata TaxID=468196 RepID=A0ABR1AW93_POLSC